MAETLFAQLVLTLKRHRFATDNLAATHSEALLDKLITALSGSLNRSFVLEQFCEQEQCSERALRQQFRSQTGMTINHYLRQLRICHAQYLLQHSEQMISEIAMQCGFEDSNYFSVVFSREVGMTPVNGVIVVELPPDQLAMPRPTILAATMITTQPGAQHAHGASARIVPLFQYQSDNTAAQHVEAHVQHPTDVVILRRNTRVTPCVEEELQVPHQTTQRRESRMLLISSGFASEKSAFTDKFFTFARRIKQKPRLTSAPPPMITT